MGLKLSEIFVVSNGCKAAMHTVAAAHLRLQSHRSGFEPDRRRSF